MLSVDFAVTPHSQLQLLLISLWMASELKEFVMAHIVDPSNVSMVDRRKVCLVLLLIYFLRGKQSEKMRFKLKFIVANRKTAAQKLEGYTCY